MTIEAEFASLIKSYGLRLVRQRNHLVYAAPDGRVFVTSKTPSDRLAARNQLRGLKRFLGLRPRADVGAM